MELQKCEEFLGLSYGCGDAHWKPAAVTQRPRCNMRTKGLIRFSATSNVAPNYCGADILGVTSETSSIVASRPKQRPQPFQYWGYSGLRFPERYHNILWAAAGSHSLGILVALAGESLWHFGNVSFLEDKVPLLGQAQPGVVVDLGASVLPGVEGHIQPYRAKSSKVMSSKTEDLPSGLNTSHDSKRTTSSGFNPRGSESGVQKMLATGAGIGSIEA